MGGREGGREKERDGGREAERRREWREGGARREEGGRREDIITYCGLHHFQLIYTYSLKKLQVY